MKLYKLYVVLSLWATGSLGLASCSDFLKEEPYAFVGPDQLGNDIGNHILPGKTSSDSHADGNGRIQMTSRNMADRISHRQNSQAERQRNTVKTDSQFGKSGCKQGTSAPAQYQPERADTFGTQRFRQRHKTSRER